MSGSAVRGDGIGIEICGSVVRGVRIRHDVPGRLSVAAEFPVDLTDDDSTLEALVLLYAELGEPDEPTRVATFPRGAMLQRVDITGRSGQHLNELRSELDRRHGIDSTVVVEDGPRRWLLLVRWNAHAARRLEVLAERAGFIDVTVEPSPLALTRVTGPDARFVRRLVAQGDAHRIVIRNRLPVAADTTVAPGRAHPDVDISSIDIATAYFDDFLTDPALAEVIDRIDERARTAAENDRADGDRGDVRLQLVDLTYPPFPAHDQRSAQRQAVALGAAIGAAGLSGPLRPVDMIVSNVEVDDHVDRPWAIEELPPLTEHGTAATFSTLDRLTRHFRSAVHRRDGGRRPHSRSKKPGR